MHKFLRRRVSQNKVRLVEGRYDLDLTYITDKIIAMQFPAVGLEAMYRNSRNGENGVVQYLETRHGKHYRVYNLCGEKKYQYPPEVFNLKLSAYPFPDHNPAPLVTVADFIADAVGFLNESPKNVVVVHCKAGRGRTGFMVCCLLLSMRIYTRAEDAIAHFSRVRTHDGKALNQPSQIRYIGYWADLLAEASAVMGGDTLIKSPRKALAFMSPNRIENGPFMKQFSTTKRGVAGKVANSSSPQFRLKSYKGVPLPVSDSILFLKSISIFNASPEISAIRLVLEQNGFEVHSQLLKRDAINMFEWHALPPGLELCGDIRLEGFDDDDNKQLFRYWFNTHFMNGGKVRVLRDDVDIVCRGKKSSHPNRGDVKTTQVFVETTSLVFDFVREASNKENILNNVSTHFMVPTLTSPVQRSLLPTRVENLEPAAIQEESDEEDEDEDEDDDDDETSFDTLSPDQAPPSPPPRSMDPDQAELSSRDRTMALYSFMCSELDELTESQQIDLLQLIQRLLNTKLQESEFTNNSPVRVSPEDTVVPGWGGKKRVTFQSAAPSFPSIGTDPLPRRRARRALQPGSMTDRASKHICVFDEKVASKARGRHTPRVAVEYDVQFQPLPRRTVLRCITKNANQRLSEPETPPITCKRKINDALSEDVEDAPPPYRASFDLPQGGSGKTALEKNEDTVEDGEFPELLAFNTDLTLSREESPSSKSEEAFRAQLTAEMEQVQRVVFRHDNASSQRAMTVPSLAVSTSQCSLAPLVPSSSALSLPPPTMTTIPPEMSSATQEQIETIIRELIANETAYAHELQMMIHHFATPLAKIARRMTLGNHYRPGDITPYQVEVVLCNIEQIAEFHKGFLKRLVQATKEGVRSTHHTATQICDVFRSHVDDMSSFYTRYVTNSPKCQKSLTALNRNKVFKDLVEAKKSYGVQGKDLDFYRLLLVPVPRISHYVSVFTELLQVYKKVDVSFSDSLDTLIVDLVAVIRAFNTAPQPKDVFSFTVSRVNKFRKNTPAELEIDITAKSLTVRNESEEDIVLVPQAVEGLKLSKNYPTKCTLSYQARQKEAVRFMFETSSARERFAKYFEDHIRSALQRMPAWAGN